MPFNSKEDSLKHHFSTLDVSLLDDATPEQYADFMIVHLENGGKISGLSDGNSSGFKIANKSMAIPKAFGGKALNVIAPYGVTITRVPENGYDHGNTYNMTDGSVSDASNVKLFYDTAQIMMDKGCILKSQSSPLVWINVRRMTCFMEMPASSVKIMKSATLNAIDCS